MYLPFLSEVVSLFSRNIPEKGQRYIDRSNSDCPFEKDCYVVEVVEYSRGWVKYRIADSAGNGSVARRRSFNMFFKLCGTSEPLQQSNKEPT